MSLFGLWERRDIGDDPGFLLGDSSSPLNNPAYPLTSLGLLNVLGGIPVDSGVQVSEYTALRMSAVYRCVSLVSSVAAALPLKTYQGDTKKVVPSNLLSNPSPDLTPFELWRLSYASRLLWGNSYQQKIRDKVGRVQSLMPITPDRVMVGRVKPSSINPSGKVFGVTDDWGTKQGLTSREILHIPGMGYDGTVGVSPIRCAAQAIGLGLAAETYSAKLFGSGNLLSGILQTEQRLQDGDAKRLQERWRTMMGGLKRSHDVAVLDAGATFQTLTMPNTDAQMLQSRQFQLSEIGRFYGVPPYLLFDTDKSSSWGCLPGDAQVLTVTGSCPIEHVQPGDKVWSYNSDSGMVPAVVTAWRMTGHKPLLTISTATRELRATSNHRVPIKRHDRQHDQWMAIEVNAGDIQAGDCLLVPVTDDTADTGVGNPDPMWGHIDITLQPVVAITAGTVEVPVYDITVADHSHFVSDGVIVHNTGLEQQARGWVMFDLHPHWLAPTEQRLTKEATPPGVEASYNVDGLLRGDSLARATLYTAMRNVGAYSANDIRDLEDLPPVPGGDQYLAQPTGSTTLPSMPPNDPQSDPGD